MNHAGIMEGGREGIRREGGKEGGRERGGRWGEEKGGRGIRVNFA